MWEQQQQKQNNTSRQKQRKKFEISKRIYVSGTYDTLNGSQKKQIAYLLEDNTKETWWDQRTTYVPDNR